MRARAARSVAAVAAVALLVAACGDGDGETDAGDDGTAAEADAGETDTDGAEVEGVDPVTLSYASFVTDQNPHSQAWEAWMERVTERTGGAVTFETYYGEALCAAPEISACTTDGRVDIGFTTVTYTPADFPANMISNVPFQTNNLQANVDALNDLAEENQAIQAEFEGLNQHLLYFGPVGLPVLAMTQPVDTLDDFAGLSIRAVGDLGGAFQALGINPVAVAPAEQYESLQRGVLDGSAFTIDGHADFRHFEVADYWYDLGEYSGSYSAMHTSMNLSVWESLDPAVQDVMTEVSTEIAESITDEFFLENDRRDCETVVAEAEHFGPLEPADEAEAWAEEWGDRLLEGWVDNANQAGVEDPEGLADDYLRLVGEYEDADPDFQGAGAICIEVAQGG